MRLADGSVQQRVYVLSPGRLRTVSLADGERLTILCNAGLGDWSIVGQHALE